MKSTIKNSVFCLGTLVLLSSCAVGKKYSRPAVNLPEEYRTQVAVTSDTINLSWRNFFKDPELVKLIEQALDKNKDIAIALLNQKQLELSFKQAKLGLLPNVDLGVGASRNYASKNSLNASLSEQITGKKYVDDFNATLTLSWEADIWGKAQMQKEKALASYLMEKENLAALKTRIVVQVVQAYNNLLTLDKQLVVAQENVTLSTNTLEMLQLQFNSAQINSLAVDQAEAQKKTAELLIPLTQQNIQIQENALRILCGEFPDAINRSTSNELYEMEDIFPTGVPANLLSRRPDLKALEYAIMAANATTGLSKAAMYPSINLTPSIGVNSYEFDNWFNLPGSLVKNIAANLSQPLFQKRALKTNYEVAKLEQEKAAEQFKLAVMVAVGEVSDAMSKVKYTDERIALVEQKKAALDKAVTNVSLLYSSGMASYLEIIVAQSNALQNDLEVTSIQKEKVDALTELYRALGGTVE